MVIEDGTQQGGQPQGSSRGRGQGATSEAPMSVPGGMDPRLGEFLQQLVTQVVQAIQTTVAPMLQKTDTTDIRIKIAKMKPPEFEGSMEPDDVMYWLTEMEKLLTAFRCPEEDKVSVATYYLKKSAYEWWKDANKPADHEPTWDEFKTKLLNQYYLLPLRMAENDEFSHSGDECETVDQAAKKYYRIQSRYPTLEFNEETKIKLFRMRLRDEIKLGMVLHHCKTFDQFIIEALEFEARLEEADDDLRYNKRQKTESPPPYSGRRRRCYNCGSEEHLVAYCTERNQE